MKIIDKFYKYKFYILTTLGLTIWLAFFDSSNWIKQIRLKSKLNQLNNQIDYYEEELANMHIEQEEVLGSSGSIEKYAREKYFLKKGGETVFVIVDENGEILQE